MPCRAARAGAQPCLPAVLPQPACPCFASLLQVGINSGVYTFDLQKEDGPHKVWGAASRLVAPLDGKGGMHVHMHAGAVGVCLPRLCAWLPLRCCRGWARGPRRAASLSARRRLLCPLPPPQVQARYSFVYRKIDGDWRITEHHSSAMPEPVAAVEEKAAQLETVGECGMVPGAGRPRQHRG